MNEIIIPDLKYEKEHDFLKETGSNNVIYQVNKFQN